MESPLKLLRRITRIPERLHTWRLARKIARDPSTYFSRRFFADQYDGTDFTAPTAMPQKFHFAADLFGNVPLGARVLDFGCGRGELTALLGSRTAAIVGVDISPSAIDTALRLYPENSFALVRPGEVPPGPFDRVFLLNVLEYVRRSAIRPLLRALANELADGGEICVQCSNARRPGGGANWPPGFTATELASEMTLAGLRVEALLQRPSEESGYMGGVWAVGTKTPDRRDSHRRRVLISYDATVGDQLCLTPAVAAYRRQHPSDYLAVRVTHPELYINNPHVDEIRWSGGKGPVVGFDLVHEIELPTIRKYRFATLQDASAAQLGIELQAGERQPQIFLSQRERGIWRERFRRPEGVVVGFAPYSRWPSKEWLLDRWRVVAGRLEAQYGAAIIYIDKGDRPFPGIGENFGGLTDLREMALLLEQCDLLIGVDNGIAHMAAAVETPSVILYGPLYAELRASGDAVTAIQAVDCIGCYHWMDLADAPRRCPLGHHKCMTDITAEMVLEGCSVALGRIGAAAT